MTTLAGTTGTPRARAPRTAPRVTLLPPEQRHLLSRFSYGINPALATSARRAGGARAWLEGELAASTADAPADECLAWWPHLANSPQRLWSDARSGARSGFAMMFDYQRYALARRIRARHQLREVMTEFWEQLLNVPSIGEPWFVFRRDYGDTLRGLAFTSYRQILRAAVLHPAMLVYLDNARSSATHPNENLGRELLELHTVGRGNYGEAEVKDSARILTGWAVDTQEGNSNPTWNNDYRTRMHYTGRVTVMGFTSANTAADGRQVSYDYLDHLARHPATANRLARRLATKFVSDDPPAALVSRLARVYLDHDTAIAPVLRALVDSSEFAAATASKVRDPAEDVVATYRALRVQLLAPRQTRSAANAILWQARTIGLMPYAWPRPDGAPLDNLSWSNPARMLASYRIHNVVSGGYYPTADVRYRARTAWLPPLPASFEYVVDHLSRQLLHQPASPLVVKACGQVLDLRGGDQITSGHRLVRYGVPRLLATILDSPDHFLR